MTGFCYARIIDEKKVEYYPFQMNDEVDDLWRRLAEFQPRYIIMEDFEFRGRASTGLNLFPCQLIGVARLYELTEPTGKCALYLQKPAQGKSYFTDPILKSKGLYKRGLPHGMDASRHLLQWLTFGAGYQFLTGDPKEQSASIINEWKWER